MQSSTPKIIRLAEIRTGRVGTAAGVRTAYAKAVRTGAVHVRAENIDGDEQADRRHHGGADKAVYAYPASAYGEWLKDHPQHAEKLVPGGFGENLVIDGLDETLVHVGDRWRIGSVLLEPCQPRQPCHVLARWFDDPSMVRALIETGRTGWYCRVVQEGAMAAGDACVLIDRVAGNWSIAQLAAAIHRKRPARSDMAAMVAMPRLAVQWQEWALSRLAMLPPEERVGPAGLEPATKPL